ncbi:MAG: DUF58 domain-containing protein [Candidatus Spechtbacterales bacterium]
MLRDELKDILDDSHLHLNLKPRSPRSSLFGIWDSPFAGDDGLEFEEDREYQPGDNFKRINAPLSSRLDQLMVKRYRETREVRMLIILDASPSMMLREKIKTAFSALSVLHISAQEVFMPASIWAVGSDHELQIRPPMRLQHIEHVIDALCGDEDEDNPFIVPREDTLSLDLWRTFLVPDSYVFVISDFLSGKDLDFKELLDYNPFHCRFMPVVVQDDLEHSFPILPHRFGVDVGLWDTEEQMVKTARLNRKRSKNIKTAHERRFSLLQEMFDTNHLSYVHCADPDVESVYKALQDALEEERSKKR